MRRILRYVDLRYLDRGFTQRTVCMERTTSEERGSDANVGLS